MKSFILLFAFAWCILGSFTPALAQGIPVNVPIGTQTSYVDIAPYIRDFYSYSIGIGALLAMTMIVIGGIQYTLSAGNIGRQSDAKDRITSAIYGLVLLLGAFLVLFTINPRLIFLDELVAGLPEMPKPPKKPPAHPINLEWARPGPPFFNLTWKDECPPEELCNFVLVAALKRTDGVADYYGAGVVARVPGRDDKAGGIYNYEIDHAKIALGQIWRVAAARDNGQESPLHDKANEYILDAFETVRCDVDRCDFPPLPPRPTITLRAARQYSIHDNSPSEVRFRGFLYDDKGILLDDLEKLKTGVIGLNGLDTDSKTWAIPTGDKDGTGRDYIREIPEGFLEDPGDLLGDDLCFFLVTAEDALRQFEFDRATADREVIDLGLTPPAGWGQDVCEN